MEFYQYRTASNIVTYLFICHLLVDTRFIINNIHRNSVIKTVLVTEKVRAGKYNVQVHQHGGTIQEEYNIPSEKGQV